MLDELLYSLSSYFVLEFQGSSTSFRHFPIRSPFFPEASLGYEMVIGKVLQVGNESFRTLNRVELIYNGYEVTAPSANLGYSKDLFVKLGGFDESFVTAEDIDLNIRCVKSGARIAVCDQCIVMNRTRDTLHGVIKQAFWNGYGRKQLAWKHPGFQHIFSPFSDPIPLLPRGFPWL